MDRYIIALITVLASALAAQAYDVWHDKPVELPEGETMLCDTTTTLTAATVHVRLSLPYDKGGTWSLLWNYKGPDNYSQARLTLPAYDKYEYIVLPTAQLTIETVVNGSATTLYTGKAQGIDTNGGYNSLMLVYDGSDRARLSWGASEASDSRIVPFDASAPAMALRCSRGAKCQRMTVTVQGEPQVPWSRFANVEALIEHINTSDNADESIWEYMDRRLDRQKAELGGRYRIATVRQGEGYDIVYLEGADVNRRIWQPLMLKGRLTPTIFIGDYDLEWYDAHGHQITGDANCRITDDHATLTVTIPEIGAQLRFRRYTPEARGPSTPQ